MLSRGLRVETPLTSQMTLISRGLRIETTENNPENVPKNNRISPRPKQIRVDSKEKKSFFSFFSFSNYFFSFSNFFFLFLFLTMLLRGLRVGHFVEIIFSYYNRSRKQSYLPAPESNPRRFERKNLSSVVRVTGASRHNGGPINGLLNHSIL